MAKKRILKKNISKIAGELFTDALLCSLFVKDVDGDAVETIMNRILSMEESFIRRAHRPDGKADKTLVKKYYKKLLVDLNTETDAIENELAKLNKMAE
ncbi:MAG: hypothetical protein PHG27_07030 [Massilibacteroides sp.]|nr:hypothetical protein [Massilibacteroides sp.]MDD3063526.1 hypothetical protein [Massilibacteroides sp.]MDD4115332.1 hypothetical protein [Massilibacteroides sp.]MDD4660770.1 hypothetical protein [Massilibacteroides sp.]